MSLSIFKSEEPYNFYEESGLSIIKNAIKDKLFLKSTKNSMDLFLRGRDIISVYPQTHGTHEPHIINLISNLSAIGFSDFLIDIGANIGLTSCQSGKNFKEVHMFEPNPYCCKILEVNSKIALNKTNYKIYEFGLGDQNIKSVLTVPINNWGGAFIKDESNSYDEATLLKKDGFEVYDESNYFNVEIEVKNTVDILPL
ncbi:MAG: FkbM family methyltransferase [Silvanigrellaceae bacterium]|nr:FkbM family methyltransferase [Silvanigrellaceae bacterium]